VTARRGELAREAVAGLVEARQRSAFSLAGLAIGVAAVVALTSVTGMARRQALAGLRELGTDVLTVSVPGGEGRRSGRLQAGDARSLAANVPSVAAASPVLLGRAPLQLGASARPAPVIGVAADLRTLVRLPLTSGRFFSPFDRGTGFCVLGANLGARAAAHGGAPVGRTLEVGGKTLTVIGVLAPVGDSPGLPLRCDDAVLLPLAATARMLGRDDPDAIVAKLAGDADERVAAVEIRRLFALTRPGLQLEISSPEAAVAQVAHANRLLAVLLAAVGSISLLLGAIGVMNVMVLSVAQRRREIGVRRSLGASRRDVWLQFLIEAVALASVGGAVGAVIGVLATAVVAWLSAWPFAVSPWGLALAVAVAAAVGVSSGLFPAHLATRVEPMAALRE
jgi:putative ABC transport system permease protein